MKSGFLVVLASCDAKSTNPHYMGAERIPAYPTPGYPCKYPEEASAIDDYVFGKYKDPDSNLIPTYALARELWSQFQSSPRKFEIILCCNDPHEDVGNLFGDAEVSLIPLGYDIAGLEGCYWSIVDDFAIEPWAAPYLTARNKDGLFATRGDAVNYLADYKAHNAPDADIPFQFAYIKSVVDADSCKPDK